MHRADVVHIKVHSPTSKRKEVLKTAIDSTKLLYSFNELMYLREKELSLINKLGTLNKNMKTIAKSFNKEAFPELPGDLEPKKVIYHNAKKTHHEKKPKMHKENDDIKNLMKELEYVEKQLKDL